MLIFWGVVLGPKTNAIDKKKPWASRHSSIPAAVLVGAAAAFKKVTYCNIDGYKSGKPLHMLAPPIIKHRLLQKKKTRLLGS